MAKRGRKPTGIKTTRIMVTLTEEMKKELDQVAAEVSEKTYQSISVAQLLRMGALEIVEKHKKGELDL